MYLANDRLPAGSTESLRFDLDALLRQTLVQRIHERRQVRRVPPTPIDGRAADHDGGCGTAAGAAAAGAAAVRRRGRWEAWN